MKVFEIVIALLLGGAALAALARRIGAPYPALVALAGAALALLPRVPTLVLDPELALALFVAPGAWLLAEQLHLEREIEKELCNRGAAPDVDGSSI